ncbi:hypothetical protein [Mycobacterium sp.]|uniref:hypothetical protein n=1 Tax=Mycobacterium sp. TaxID=1785 RepID=UPI002C66FFBC|nr:hypothetical protein [Mycobacterium sp.]HTQ22618.1 hypothetical protein [Mycobacterium sp.]
MNANNGNRTVDGPARSAEPAPAENRRDARAGAKVNWGLAICTVPAAAIVMLFALGAVMSTDACTEPACPHPGRGGIDFGVAFYGAPVVAFAVILVSLFSAKRRSGIVVPLLGFALLVADVAIMAVTVAG